MNDYFKMYFSEKLYIDIQDQIGSNPYYTVHDIALKLNLDESIIDMAIKHLMYENLIRRERYMDEEYFVIIRYL